MNDPSDVSDPAVKTRVFDALKAIMPDAPGTFNQAMMELGATVCVPNGQPLCESCPLRSVCRARKAGTAGELPNKAPKKPRTVENRTVFALYDANAPLLQKRPDKGLLAGLYELPNVTGTLSAEQAMQWLSAHGLHLTGDLSVYAAKHVFTHIEWRMRVYAADVAGDGVSAFIRDDGTRSIPTAFAVCLKKDREVSSFLQHSHEK